MEDVDENKLIEAFSKGLKEDPIKELRNYLEKQKEIDWNWLLMHEMDKIERDGG